MLCPSAGNTFHHCRMLVAILTFALLLGLALRTDAEAAVKGPSSSLYSLGNWQSSPRDPWSQLQCQDTVICPGCITLAKKTAEAVLSGRCSPVLPKKAEEVNCDGHHLPMATAQQLQQGQCLDACVKEAAALCPTSSRKILQIGEHFFSSMINLSSLWLHLCLACHINLLTAMY